MNNRVTYDSSAREFEGFADLEEEIDIEASMPYITDAAEAFHVGLTTPFYGHLTLNFDSRNPIGVLTHLPELRDGQLFIRGRIADGAERKGFRLYPRGAIIHDAFRVTFGGVVVNRRCALNEVDGGEFMTVRPTMWSVLLSWSESHS